MWVAVLIFAQKTVRNKLRATIPPQAQALCFDGEMLSVRAIQMPKEPLMLSTKSLLAAAIALLVTPFITPAQAQSWPTRSVRFIVPFGPGAGADIGARLFAEKLSQKWGHAVVVENKPGGDSIVAIQAFLSANDDHVLLFGPAGNFTVHPFLYSKLPYNPAELIPIARASQTILALAVKQDAPYKTMKEFTEAARAAPGKFNSAMVQGITEFTFWGYAHYEKLDIPQVPYRDINVAPTDLGEGRIQVVMSSYAIVQPQIQAGRIRPVIVNNKSRAPAFPDIPTAREAGYPSLEVEGLVGLFGLKTMSAELKEKIAADFRAVAADGAIGERLKSTAQVINIGGPKEFADSIDEQRNNVAAVVKAIDFKPKN
jgi:tripartite-type tricarboxylate transporter receptor subunit TctC